MKKFLPLIIIILASGAILLANKDRLLSQKPAKMPQPTPAVAQKEANSEATNEAEFTPEQLEGYYRVYKNPFVLYLRKALDAYLAGNSSDANITSSVIEKDIQGEIMSGLSSFDKEYYKSKFIVLAINDSIAGGKEIQIIFQNKQDRIFNAWVYQLATGEFELRGFGSKEHPNEEEMTRIRKTYGEFLNDPEHAL